MDAERPTPLVDDLDRTRETLCQWLAERLGHAVTIENLRIPEGSGMSNVTLLFDISYEQRATTHRQACVGRLQPEIARPVFPEYDLSLQYRVMEELGQHSDIPVPALLGLEQDTSVLGVQFYVMKHTAGRIPSDMPPYNMDGWMVQDTDEAQRESLWNAAVDTLARFHTLDYRALGFADLEVQGKTPLQQQLDYWQHYHDWGLEGEQHLICMQAMAWLRANQPADEPTVLCWGDSRIGNMIFSEDLGEVAAVLDWEMAVLGNPVQDIAWFNFLDATFAEGLGLPRLPGLPDYASTTERWARASRFDAEHYDYYEIFAGLRYGLLLSRIMLATGQASEVQENFACQLLARRMASHTQV